MVSKNQQCLEKILERLTNLIVINESDTKELNKLVNMAALISAQISEAQRIEAGIEFVNENENNLQ